MKDKNKSFILLAIFAIIALLVIGVGVYVSQNVTKNSLSNPSVVVDEVPNIIGKITTNLETGDQKPEINLEIVDQVRKDVHNGKLSWFKDPIEVSKKYSNHFGISSDSKYSLEQAATAGEYSGLMHSIVSVTDSAKSYKIYLISEQSQPYVWIINAVIDIQQSSKLRVNFFSATSTYDTDGVSYQEIVTKFGDGSTLFYLNVNKPIVTFYLNQPAKSSTVNSNSIIVKLKNNIVLVGATAKVITEQSSSHGMTFPSHSIEVDLSGISNLKNYVGQNVQIILTDKIKDNSNNSLQQCYRSYNQGECITDIYGQKIKVFGAELKLYSI